MADFLKEITELSAEEKQLLELLLKEEGAELGSFLSGEEEGKTFPLSFAQARLWFLEQLVPGSPVYNIPGAVRLRGSLNVTALEQSLNQIIRRHEVLRTIFIKAQGEPVQIVTPMRSLNLSERVDLSHLTESEREAAALRLAKEQARQPFDLASGPLVRAMLIRMGDQDHILILIMHHIIADGWSTGILIVELAALYEAFCEGKPSPLPKLPIQYAEFAAWQRAWLRGEVLEEQLRYWRQQLNGMPGLLELPTDRPRPAVQSFQGATQPFILSKELSEALKVLCQQEGVTTFMLLLAAFQILLMRYTEQDDIVVGSPIANRNRAEIEGLIGFFANTLVLRTNLSGNPTFRELLKRVQEVTLSAYAHQDMPFEKLVEELQPDRNLNHVPLLQVVFVLQNFPMPVLELPGLNLSTLEVDSGTAKFDLTLFMWDKEQGLTGTLEYSTDLFEAQTISEMLGNFQTLLESIVAHPEERLLSLLARIPKQKLSITVTSSFTSEPLEQSLSFWMERLNLPSKIKFAPYNQVFQQLLDPSSLIATNAEGVNIILLRLEDWISTRESSLRPQLPDKEKTPLDHRQKQYELPNGTVIAHQNKYETEYLYREIFEDQAYLKHGITLSDGDCVFDVGANIGLFTLFVQQMCPSAVVYAFEPSPPIFEILRRNSNPYGAQVKLFNCGLSNSSKTSEFTYYPRSSVFSGYYANAVQIDEAVRSIIRNQQQTLSGSILPGNKYTDELLEGRFESETFSTPLRTLSSVISEDQIACIDLLKIDAEKSEMDILSGINESDWEKIRQVVIEVHDTEGGLLSEIKSLLNDKGFELTVAQESLLKNTGLHNIYARRRALANGSLKTRPQLNEICRKLEHDVVEFLVALKVASKRVPATFLIGICPPSAKVTADAELNNFLQVMERLIFSQAGSWNKVHLLDLSQLASDYHVDRIDDPYSDRVGHIPFRFEYFAALGTFLARKIHAHQRVPYKVIVLDCDQTLWNGVCGEDGPTGIRIDPPSYNLQQFMVEQHDAGKLLCLCSKNNAEDVVEVFRHRPEMPLNLEHFVAQRINWQPKSENLRALARELNLSLGSFILIDDDPVECAEVRARCPEVLCLQLPAERDQIPEFLRHVWAFDTLRSTKEDKHRTIFYRQNETREKFRAQSLTLQDFLSGLKLKINISTVGPHQLERVAQLTQRTNQFNLTTIRRSIAEMQQLLEREEVEAWAVEVSDRFGDYGLVGLLVFELTSSALRVDSFLLSCRALGRHVEDTMLVKLAQIARERNCSEIILPYRKTQKNAQVYDFLSRLGSAPLGYRNSDHVFVFTVASIISNPNLKATDWGYCFGWAPASEGHDGVASDGATSRKSTRLSSSPATGETVTREQESYSTLHLIATQFHTAEQIVRALREQKRGNVAPSGDFVPPHTPLEKILAGIWMEVLGIERIGVHDNFFKSGGHSLLGTQLMSRISETFEIDLPMRWLFESPTIARLAAAMVQEPDQQVKVERTARLLSDVLQLSEEEAERMLSEKLLSGRGGGPSV